MAVHFEFLLEEQSMEAFLRAWLPRILPAGNLFELHPFQGKQDLLKKLEKRLKGYAKWIPEDYRIVVIVDCDHDDCQELKNRLEDICKNSGLQSKKEAESCNWQIATRIAIKELEAWYFGDWQAVCEAYPRLPDNVSKRAKFRTPDTISNTWECFERILQRHEYYKGGLQKTEAAREIGNLIDRQRSKSPSFISLANLIDEAVECIS